VATDQTASIPEGVVDAFGLRDARIVERLESYGNDNWLIAAADGRRFVLRRQHLNAAPERIAFQLDLQQHIASHGIASPQPVRASEGGYVVSDASGIPWLLFAYADGPSYDFARIEQTQGAGAMLARFHAAASSFAATCPQPEYRASTLACWTNVDADAAELATMFGDSADDELTFLTECWRDAVSDWPFERVAALPAGLVHGDYHGRNMVFAGDDVAAIFDFDDVQADPYVCDVAEGALKFGRTSRGSLEIRPEFARAFLEGYQRVRIMLPEERAALPIMLAMIHPPHPQNLRYWRDRRGVTDASRLRREVAIMRALRGQMAMLAEVFGP
jgi:homoserine kinase type II